MKKNLGKLLYLSLVFSLMVHMFAPLTVLADDDIVLTFNVGENQNVSYVASGTSLGAKVGNGNVQYMDFKLSSTTNPEQDWDNSAPANVKSVTCSDNKNCTVTVGISGGRGFHIVTSGDAEYSLSGNLHNILTSGTITANEKTNTPPPQNPPENPGQNPGPGQNNFDGNAVLYWSCGTGTCYHVFDDISGTDVNMIAASTITADNDNTKTFDVNAEKKFFGPKASFDAYVAANNPVNWATVATGSLMGEDLLDYPPVPTPTVDHAYVSYANRNFKAFVYDDDFKAITRGPVENLNYYPGYWADWFTRQDFYAITGTTKENPVVIDNVILDPTVLIDAEGYHVVIKSIKPLDVPEGAVTVNKVDNFFKIDFASRYYDRVVFELTDTDNNKYYVMINRIATKAKIDHDNTGNEFIFTSLYFDRSTSYTDYIVKAKIFYKDGSIKTVEMTNANRVDDGLGNTITNVKEVDSENPGRDDWTRGKGIKIASFKYDLARDEKDKIEKAYVFVEFKGSTKDNYAGALAGAGNGTEVEV